MHSRESLTRWLVEGPDDIVETGNFSALANNGDSTVVARSDLDEGCGNGVMTPPGSVTVRHLDWTNFNEDNPLGDNEEPPRPIDVIVGSDLVYNVDVLPGLAKLIKALLVANQSRGTNSYIACTNRKQESISLFLQLIKDQGLVYEVVFKRAFSPADCNMVWHEPLQPVTLYKISL